ncbi:hypothetical protein ACFL33_02105 [Pseudomonadota bacterium]
MPERAFSLVRLFAAAVIAALLVCAATAAWLARDLPGDTSESLQLDTSDLKFVMGSGQADGERLMIDGFTDGYALLSSGPVEVNADEFRFLHVTLDRLAAGEAPSFFWRRSEAPADLIQLRLRESGDLLIDLSGRTDWRGEITELGFLFHDDGGPAIAFGPTTLEPDRLALRLRLMWNGWTAFEHWTQKSVNFLFGGAPDQAVHLPLVLIIWIGLTLGFMALIAVLGGKRSGKEFMVGGAVIFILAWMVLDLRWTANSVRQLEQTRSTYWGVDESEKQRRGLDGEIYEYIERLKREVLPEQPARILIVGDEDTVEYALQRAKYHLLPHSVYATREFPDFLSTNSMDYLVFFAPLERLARIPGFQSEWNVMFSIVDRDNLGTVFQIDTPALTN